MGRQASGLQYVASAGTFLLHHQFLLLTFIFDFLGGEEEREHAIK